MPAQRFSTRGQSCTSNHELLARNNPREMLEILLALDRSVVEVSMQLYNLDQRDRRAMRSQNRRLHAAFRDHFPDLLRTARSKTGKRVRRPV